MATHSSIFAWNSMNRGAWQATVHGVAESDMPEPLTLTWQVVLVIQILPAVQEIQEVWLPSLDQEGPQE